MTQSRTTQARGGRMLEDIGVFVLRTPLLAREQVWASVPLRASREVDTIDAAEHYRRDVEALRSAMREALRDAAVREAIHLASPRISSAVDAWLQDPTAPANQGLEPVLVRYLTRMSGRPTPFGLFAGSAIGRIGAGSRLWRSPRAALARTSYLDSGWLMHLCATLSGRQEVVDTLRYLPNSSIYPLAGSWRWAEPQQLAGRRVYRLSTAEDSAELRAVLARATGGATRPELCQAVIDAVRSAGDEASEEEARAFVEELVGAQLLMAELAPAITGEAPLEALCEQLRAHGAFTTELAALEHAHQELRRLDTQGVGASPARYTEIIGALPAEMGSPQAVRVDMHDDAPGITLSQRVVDEVANAVWLLDAMNPAVNHHLERFKREFSERYGTRMVALCEVLDEENGIGFERGSELDAAPEPLFRGLQLGARTAPTGGAVFEPRHAVLLGLLEAMTESGADELDLAPETLEQLRLARPHRPAESISAVIRFAGAPADLDLGRARVFLQAFCGPPGGMHIARLAPALPGLVEPLRELARREQASRPGAVFAEVVHAPEGGFATVVRRPLLREQEIEYLGVSGAPGDRRIALADLDVTVAGDRVVLWSRRLGREVIPRLTSAHTFGHRQNLGAYRFLGTLQHNDGVSGLGWTWGPLEARRFLPRVRIGRVVVARARWRLDRGLLRPLLAPTPLERFAAVQELRSGLRLPRFVTFGEADQQLMLDLDNPLLCEAFVDEVRGAPEVTLTEAFPAPGEDPVHGPEGAYAHEIVLPLVRALPSTARPASLPAPAPVRPAFIHAPGGEWLYARVFASAQSVDALLHQVVTPLLDEARDQRAFDRWFFLRYDAPSWHLRLRFHGPPRRLWGDLLPMLQARLQPWLEEGRVSRMELGCYEPELERYGGEQALALVERIFEADSEACLSLLGVAASQRDEQLRWRMALIGVDRLLGDLGQDDQARLALTARHRAALAREHAADPALERALGARFRPLRRELEALLHGGDGQAAREAEPILHQRSMRVVPLHRMLVDLERGGRLGTARASIDDSLVHMFVNRMSRSGPRAQEYALHDMLERLYDGRLARARRAG